jgi:hypothetical protein
MKLRCLAVSILAVALVCECQSSNNAVQQAQPSASKDKARGSSTSSTTANAITCESLSQAVVAAQGAFPKADAPSKATDISPFFQVRTNNNHDPWVTCKSGTIVMVPNSQLLDLGREIKPMAH